MIETWQETVWRCSHWLNVTFISYSKITNENSPLNNGNPCISSCYVQTANKWRREHSAYSRMSVVGRINDKPRKPLFNNHHHWWLIQKGVIHGERLVRTGYCGLLPKSLSVKKGERGIYGGETKWWRITSPVVRELATFPCIASSVEDSCRERMAWVWAWRDIRQSQGSAILQNEWLVLFPLKILKDRERPKNHSKSKETGEAWPLTATYDLGLYPGQERSDMVGTVGNM